MESMEEGDDQSDRIVDKYKEAKAFFELEQHEEVLKTLNEIYDIQKSRYPLEPDHLRIISAMNNIASTLIVLTKYDEALKMLNEIDEKIERKNPGLQLATAVQHTRASLYHKQGKHLESFRMYNKIIVIFKKEFGLNHSYTLAAQTNIAGLLHEFGKNLAALHVYKSVLERKMATLGPNHISTLRTQRSVAYMFIHNNRYYDAINVVNDLYKQRCNTLGPDHPTALAALKSLELLKLRAAANSPE